MNVNAPITPWVVAGRIVAIIGMGFFSACAILLAIIPEWLLAAGAAALFLPFLGLIVLVERYSSKHGLIGPSPPDPLSIRPRKDVGRGETRDGE